MQYPALIERDSTGFMASFRDIPEALTCADTVEETKEMAADALLTAMDFYFEDRRTVSLPSPAQDGEVLIALPLIVSAKIYLLNEMVRQNVSQAELARRLGTRPQEITRIIDLAHATKIDTVAGALAALGTRLDVNVA